MSGALATAEAAKATSTGSIGSAPRFGGEEDRNHAKAPPTTATASIALGGHGVLEHSWFDLDPSLPDAATSILRLYNRAERRWESLYLTNRGNTLLDFGGAKEGDRIVLHLFDTRLGDTISRFVFHNIEPDGYRWFAESSTDRGATFATTWTIDMTRR